MSEELALGGARGRREGQRTFFPLASLPLEVVRVLLANFQRCKKKRFSSFRPFSFTSGALSSLLLSAPFFREFY